MKKAIVLLVCILYLCSCKNQDNKSRLAKSSLEYKNGWFVRRQTNVDFWL